MALRSVLMAETTTFDEVGVEEAEILASIERSMQELAGLRVEMQQDQEETDRLLAENQIRLTNIEAILNRLAASR